MTRTKTLGFRLEVGDKYAAIAAESDTYQQDAAGKWPNGISTTTTAFVEFDSYWREWLGSIRTEHFESSNFFIIASVRSEKPDVLDRENQLISQSVKHFYLAVLLTGRVPFYQKPLLITGGCTEKGTTIRQLSDIECPIQFSGIEQDSLNLSVLERASRLAAKIPQLWADSAKYKRLKRVMNIYWDARTRPDILDRLHEYTRCIEGFIIPSTGQTARQFRSRTELFIGPRHHNLMKSIFDVRSAIEHLNEHLNMASKNAPRSRPNIQMGDYRRVYCSHMHHQSRRTP